MSNVVGRRGWRHRLVGVSAVAALSLGTLGAVGALSACSTEPDTKPAATPTSAAKITVKDPWVKTAESGMTAAFGTLVNNTDKDLTVVSATSPITSMMELHEVVDVNGSMVMRPKQGGFKVPAHGEHILKPGGDHIMIMGVKQALKPGADITVTLTFDDGSTVTFTAVAKDFAGGNESYKPSASPMQHGSMSPMPSMG